MRKLKGLRPNKIEDGEREPMGDHVASSLKADFEGCGLSPGEKADGLEMITMPDKPPYIAYLKYKVWEDGIEWRAIFVREEYRQKGVGSALINEMFKMGRKLGKEWAYVRASTDGKSDVVGKFITGMGRWKPIPNPQAEAQNVRLNKNESFTWERRIARKKK